MNSLSANSLEKTESGRAKARPLSRDSDSQSGKDRVRPLLLQRRFRGRVRVGRRRRGETLLHVGRSGAGLGAAVGEGKQGRDGGEQNQGENTRALHAAPPGVAELGTDGISPDRARRAGHSGSAARPRGVAGFFRLLPRIPEKHTQRQGVRRFRETLIHSGKTTGKRKTWILLSSLLLSLKKLAINTW